MSSTAGALSDEDLARGAQQGSLADFEELVRRYEVRLLRFLAQGCRNEADAADLTQDAFVAAFRNLASFDCSRCFATWLFTIARRKQIDYFRSKGRAEESTAEPERVDEDDPASQLARREDHQNLWVRARAVLSELQYQALWLRYAEEMPVDQVAQVLRRTQTHVKVILFRSRSILAAGLGDLVAENNTVTKTQVRGGEPSPGAATRSIPTPAIMAD